MTASLSILMTRLRPCSSTEIWRESQSRLRHLQRAKGVGPHSEASDLSPLAVVDGGAAAGHPADGAVLQLQLQPPVVHRQHDPRAIQVPPRKKDHPLGVVGAEVKFCREAAQKGEGDN